MRYSLSTKISVVFAIAFGLVCILFITFGRIQLNQAFDRMTVAQINSINYLLGLYERNTPPENLDEYFSNFNLVATKDKNLISNVLTRGDIVFTRQTPIGDIVSLKYQNSMFMHIKNLNFSATFESSGGKNLNDPLWVGFFITIILLGSLYFSVLKSLAPLKKLNNNIKKFATGNLETATVNVEGDDEIAQVAKEFDKAVIKIKELIRSRQLFLRTIMHELKTPIGKGRIVSEMIPNELQKKRLINIFERLEILINEFAKIEQLLSKSYSINYEDYHFSLILEQAKDLLMLDDWDKKVELNLISDPLLKADFQMFSLALKNLIDNALKYSNDQKVYITSTNEQICIANSGDPLPVDIAHYKQAFVRNINEKVSGMGLGLYIIDRICNMHKYCLDYYYSDGKHHFCIVFNKNKASCEIPKKPKFLKKKK
ncbi:ArsS family sensor histidine kinase [Campylobacter ureolyticus]|uniref:histidine kinase n=1 Tax=Campylobacter ureolyticus TaxID=827 RepID=A0AAE7E905_9BACT|nr:ArsS family sensor histidine kinase [Campylobacter ureolyticus]MCR8684115.1 ArsS family sensor histidine kinase [Campylobacter ureolyticus]QKF83837.1 two-component system sensor histidine kinase [Campylobacter ureolyticus]QQY36009.1 HAMP domain-containing histidine kinase [Campylobacter ureolyticus]SUX24646.1 two-component sensor [Campylobacter ureolyticus]